jgi:hypothetical protein
MREESSLAHRSTITALVGVYQQATEDIATAYAMLAAAKTRLRATFKDTLDVVRRNSHGDVSPAEVEMVLAEIKRSAWTGLVDRMEIRKLLSIKRREDLDRQLSGDSRNRYEKIPELPELTEVNILAMFKDSMAKASDYANEAVYEVFDWLRPQGGRTADLKTNHKWRVGKKVIIGYAVEHGYGRCAFRPTHHYEKNLIALDNVMHMLDGQGCLKGYYGPLCEAIKDSPDGTGETEYFKFKCCKNKNLHIEFKRPDLVAKINKTAGGNRLQGRG